MVDYTPFVFLYTVVFIAVCVILLIGLCFPNETPPNRDEDEQTSFSFTPSTNTTESTSADTDQNSVYPQHQDVCPSVQDECSDSATLQ